MPTPKLPYLLSIKVTGGTASDVYVNIRNGRTRDYKKVKTASNEVVANLLDLTGTGVDSGTHTDYAVGDVIEMNVSGYRTGSAVHTVGSKSIKGGEKITITLTDVSSTTAIAVNIG